MKSSQSFVPRCSVKRIWCLNFTNLHKDKFDSDDDYWYYSDKDGKLVASEIKTINGKKYAFDERGVMKDGLKVIQFAENSTTEIAHIYGDGGIEGMKSTTQFKDGDQFKDNMNTVYAEGYSVYYFGSGDDGSMKTGKQNVSIDGETFAFSFNKSGSTKGQGKLGVDSDKYYLGGMLLKADKDDKYAVVAATKKDGKYTKIELLTTEEFLKEFNVANTAGKGYSEYYDVKADAKDGTDTENGTVYRLVNTAGTVQKSKTKAKDGSDRCFKVAGNKQIEAVFVED